MNINRNWRVSTDKLNTILEHRKRIPAGKNRRTGVQMPAHDSWQIHGYYSDVASAVIAYLDVVVKTAIEKQSHLDAKAIIKAVSDAKAEIVTAVGRNHAETVQDKREGG